MRTMIQTAEHTLRHGLTVHNVDFSLAREPALATVTFVSAFAENGYNE